MDLILVRHAIAEDPQPDKPDAAREVTRRGRRRFRGCVQGMAEIGLRLDRVVHSPILRAVQTADYLRPILDGDTEVTDLLAQPPGDALLELLAPYAEARVALVGHEPWLGELASLLLTGKRNASGNLPFRKGGVAWLDGDPVPGEMSLRAFLPPLVLRAVANARR